MLSSRLSFFGGGGSNRGDSSVEGHKSDVTAFVKLQTDKDVYRSGDSILVTIEICNPLTTGSPGVTAPSLLIERLGIEIKGIEKLDTQWFATQKPLPGTKQKRGWNCVFVELINILVHSVYCLSLWSIVSGEHVFLDCSALSIVSNQIMSSGATKNC